METTKTETETKTTHTREEHGGPDHSVLAVVLLVLAFAVCAGPRAFSHRGGGAHLPPAHGGR